MHLLSATIRIRATPGCAFPQPHSDTLLTDFQETVWPRSVPFLHKASHTSPVTAENIKTITWSNCNGRRSS